MDEIPLKDPEAFRLWLLNHPYYTDWDIAHATGERLEAIINFRQKHKIRRRPQRAHRQKQAIRPTQAVPPPAGDWRDEVWFNHAYLNYPAKHVARAAGVRVKHIVRRAIELGLGLRDNRHPFNRRDWLYEHYVHRGYTIKDLARKARVSNYVIRCWMSDHGIAPRSSGTTNGAPVWWQKLKGSLRALQRVKYKSRPSGALSVNYSSGQRDFYTHNASHAVNGVTSFYLIESDIRLTKIPKVHSSRSGMSFNAKKDPLDFYVGANEMRDSSFLERRVLFHTLSTLISSVGFAPIDFTDGEIRQEMPDFADGIDEYLNNFTLSMRPADAFKGPVGFRFMTTFFQPVRALKRCLMRPDYLLRAMVRIEKNTSRPLSLYTLLSYLAATPKLPFFQFGLPLPKMYYALFKRLNIKGPILDIFPGMGAKFLAAQALGINYYTVDKDAVTYADSQGISKVIGHNMDIYEGQKVEWIIYDNDLSIRDRELPKMLLPNTQHLLCFDRGATLSSSYKIPISWNKYTGSAIYFAVD